MRKNTTSNEIDTSRLDRQLDIRATFERPQQWMPADLLPEPDKQPGYDYRWVRISTLNVTDHRNITGKLREGWEPVSVEEQPKFRLLVDPNSRFKDTIEIGGLLLCKTPIEFTRQRNAHFQRQTNAQTEAVDNSFMRQSDARMPLFREGKSSTSFGKGF
jgi:hypothetical protein